jgi:hypothetical protein
MEEPETRGKGIGATLSSLMGIPSPIDSRPSPTSRPSIQKSSVLPHYYTTKGVSDVDPKTKKAMEGVIRK